MMSQTGYGNSYGLFEGTIPDRCLKALRKTTINLNQYSWVPSYTSTEYLQNITQKKLGEQDFCFRFNKHVSLNEDRALHRHYLLNLPDSQSPNESMN
jgi:hypothetical protein